MKEGKVYLVGAGPGDPGLISVKGLESLKKADVVIYDRLLDERLLNLASPTAEMIYVGKTPGEHTKPQVEINQLLVEKAKEGKTVVRLKGGDPFVLGRGGEEAEVLAQNSIPFEVVPGITSAIAVPAYAGIPVTHRGVASSFAVITGHEDPGKDESSINWEKLATGVDTLVFLMGAKNLSEIVSRLIEFGRPSDTPVAVIKEGTRPEQKTVVGSLGDIVAKVKDHHLMPPAIIVVGEVVRLRDELCWFDNRPLFGKRILVTRSRHQVSTLSQLLAERGAEPIELPAIDIQPVADSRELDEAIANLKRYHWIVFTSINGVAAFWQRLKNLKLDSRAMCGLQIGAIGPATAEALAVRGVTSDYVPETYTTEGILAGLGYRDIAGQRFLLPRADKADNELVQGIHKLGAEAHEVAVYHTVPANESIAEAKRMLIAGEIDVITFTSSSTVTNLVAAFQDEPLPVNQAKIACIGPKTAVAATRAGLEVDILAGEQTIPGLVGALEEYFGEEM
ncbi:MAG: uroporphyrinogen-III C-methyltransferase [Dehalococcoidales bacterium]|nr:uroporphyrinogen-III C-methyltransferase [Dehalococcoidales bacterium]